jgi:hypothetical protein
MCSIRIGRGAAETAAFATPSLKSRSEPDRPDWSIHLETGAGLLQRIGMLAAKRLLMREIKLSGREAAVVRAIGFAESMLGAEILDSTRMEPEDVGDTLNGLIAAGFVETIPYAEQVDLAEMPSTAFEVNPAYVHELRNAISRR